MFLILALVVVALSGVQAKIPDYIQVCKKNDPKLDDCIIRSIEKLRPTLIKGIPELDVPPLEPLHIPQIVISRGGAFRAIGNDIIVRGASNFEILSLKSNLETNEFVVGLRIPYLQFDAEYDVNAKILSVFLKGKGPITANATDVQGSGILKGHKVTEGGRTYLKIDSLDLKLKMKNYSVKLENLFSGNKDLGEVVNVALNENKKDFMNLLRPRAEETTSEVLLDIANRITTHFEYDELFPAT